MSAGVRPVCRWLRAASQEPASRRRYRRYGPAGCDDRSFGLVVHDWLRRRSHHHGLFYAKPLRRTALETIPQFLAQNFGLTCGVFSSIVSSIGILFSAVASCLPAIYIISVLFGISFVPATILLVLAVAAYAFFGGMKSAGVGGILKMIVIWITMAIAGFMAGHAVLTDPAVSSVLPSGTFNLFHGDISHILANFASVVIGMLCTQSYIQAIFSASNPRTASVAAFTAALISLPVGLPCAMVASTWGRCIRKSRLSFRCPFIC